MERQKVRNALNATAWCSSKGPWTNIIEQPVEARELFEKRPVALGASLNHYGGESGWIRCRVAEHDCVAGAQLHRWPYLSFHVMEGHDVAHTTATPRPCWPDPTFYRRPIRFKNIAPASRVLSLSYIWSEDARGRQDGILLPNKLLNSPCSQILEHSGQEPSFPLQSGTQEQRDLERQGRTSNIREKAEGGRSTAIMLALQDGQAGMENLKAWASYAQQHDVEFPPVWILCPNLPVCKELVETTPPELQLLVVDTDSSWKEALNKFVLQVQNQRRPPFTYLIALRYKN